MAIFGGEEAEEERRDSHGGFIYIKPTATSSTLSRRAKSVKSSQAFWVRVLMLEGRRLCWASSSRGIVSVGGDCSYMKFRKRCYL